MDAHRQSRSGAAADAERLAAWLGRVALGDRRSFEALYRASAPHLFAQILRMIQDRDLAEDVLQEVYAEVWHKADTYRPALAAPMTWLRMLAQRRAIDALRRRRAAGGDRHDAQTDPEQLEGQSAAPDEVSEGRVWNRHLSLCLDRLTASQRRVVIELYVHGWTQQELVRRLGSPLGTIKSWARRGLEALRNCLDELTGGERE